MNRRRLTIAMLTMLVAPMAAARAVAEPSASALTFVRALYERETERHNKRSPPDNADFVALFTQSLRDLIDAPRIANASMPVGPILHALFGRGVLPGAEVTLTSVTGLSANDTTAALRVTLATRGERKQLVVHVARETDRWRIADIDYAPGDTLVDHYKRITGR